MGAWAQWEEEREKKKEILLRNSVSVLCVWFSECNGRRGNHRGNGKRPEIDTLTLLVSILTETKGS